MSSSDDETSRASKPRNRQGKVTVSVVSSDDEISMERYRKMKARAGKRKRQSKVSVSRPSSNRVSSRTE